MANNASDHRLSDPDLVIFTRGLIQTAREEAKRSGASDGPAKELQPGATIDLGHRNIHLLPDEVVELMKNEIERLALAHNQLSSFPKSLASCSRLRYLNIRCNFFKDFPEEILQLSSLEILDISKNRLQALPENINQLSSLKVFAVQKNRIEKLPMYLGDIGSLQVLKLDGNPLTFPPLEICTLRNDTPAPSNDNEKDALITTQVKRYLKQIQTRERLRIDSEGDPSEGNLETPRPRRLISGRFPVRPSISGSENLSINKNDYIATNSTAPRSHIRGASQQNYAARRPSLAPIINENNLSERNRSNSESVMSAAFRTKRMGIVTRKLNQQNSDENSRVRRLSHFRGLSHGSMISNSSLTNGTNSSSPVSLSDKELLERNKRPLSDLLEERKRKSKATDSLVEASKSIFYAMNQLHEPVSSLLESMRGSKSGGRSERSELERRFGVTRIQLEELNRQIRLYETVVEEDEEVNYRPSAEDIKHTCNICVEHYMNICLLLYEYVDETIIDMDPRFVRTLLLLLYGSTIELRNACAVIGADLVSSSPPLKFPPRPITAERIVTPTQNRVSGGQQRNIVSFRNNLELTSPESAITRTNSTTIEDASRTSTMTSVGLAVTPRSTDSFPSFSSTMSRSSTVQGVEDPEEERLFECIYLKLASGCKMVNDAMPGCRSAFIRVKGLARVGLDMRRDNVYNGALLVDRCEAVIDAAKNLSRRLSGIKLKDPSIRTQINFWQLCRTFMESWSDLAGQVREVAQYELITEEIKITMRPIQKIIKEISQLINASPWSSLAVRSPVTGAPSLNIADLALSPPSNYSTLTTRHNPLPTLHHLPHSINTGVSPSYPLSTPSLSSANSGMWAMSASSNNSSTYSYLSSVPATPLSAALGPAAQATVPISSISPATNGYTASSSSTATPTQAFTLPHTQQWQQPMPNNGGKPQSLTQSNLELQLYPPPMPPATGPSGQQTGFFAGNVFERADRLLAMQQQGGRSRV